jgi:predicted esterase
MEKYKVITTLADQGPYISKLILELPCEIGENDITKDSFNVYVERKDIDTGEVIFRREIGAEIKLASKGYQKVLKAYPCDDKGKKCNKSIFAALELPEEQLGKRIEGSILTSKYIKNDYRITLLHNLPGIIPVNGLVFDTCTDDICPQLKGWENGRSSYEKLKINYGYFSPDFEKLRNPTPDFFGNVTKLKSEKLPLIVWLHGAGEGGQDSKIAYTGNKVANLSSPTMQKKLEGAAWVLVPQCPTVWMDDGVEQLGRSNQSIYVEPLKASIDEFIAGHEEQIDRSRIYIGGLSNGGFMTIRMLIDYPNFFAGAIPTCECFYKENITKEIIEKLKDIPTWFVHAKGDELVPPQETAIHLYKELKKAGAKNVHFTYFDHMEDLTGMYKDDLGRPMQYFDHAVWIHVYNDDCYTDIDGGYVMFEGEPITLWEWLGKQHKE